MRSEQRFFFLVQSEAWCDWSTRDQNAGIKGRKRIATVCVTTLTAWRQMVAAEPNTFPKRSSTGSTEVGTYLLTHICCQGKSTRFSCNKRSPFNPLRHCGSPVASLFDCSENLQAISITLLLAEVPRAGRGGGGGEGKSARRRRQRESQRVNKGKMKTINLKCRAGAATRYRVDSPPFRGKITVGSTLILEKGESGVAWLFLFSGGGGEEKKKYKNDKSPAQFILSKELRDFR